MSTGWLSIDSLRKQQADSSHTCFERSRVCAGQTKDSHGVKGFQGKGRILAGAKCLTICKWGEGKFLLARGLRGCNPPRPEGMVEGGPGQQERAHTLTDVKEERDQSWKWVGYKSPDSLSGSPPSSVTGHLLKRCPVSPNRALPRALSTAHHTLPLKQISQKYYACLLHSLLIFPRIWIHRSITSHPL